MTEKTSSILRSAPSGRPPTAFGRPREYLNNRYVYFVVSPRARGLTVGLNFNPDKQCNFDCVYCEVDRSVPGRAQDFDIEGMMTELKQTLAFIESGQIRQHPRYAGTHEDLVKLRDVVISGDGEPTLAPVFFEALKAITDYRDQVQVPHFKIVLLTNTTGLDLTPVQTGLKLLSKTQDEIWVKLDAGTQELMNRVNRSNITIENVIANISNIGRQRPIVIQSLFTLLQDQEPSSEEIDAYIRRLKELITNGTIISRVQVYSATPPFPNATCGHLPLKTLNRIAAKVRESTGLKTEVF